MQKHRYKSYNAKWNGKTEPVSDYIIITNASPSCVCFVKQSRNLQRAKNAFACLSEARVQTGLGSQYLELNQSLEEKTCVLGAKFLKDGKIRFQLVTHPQAWCSGKSERCGKVLSCWGSNIIKEHYLYQYILESLTEAKSRQPNYCAPYPKEVVETAANFRGFKSPSSLTTVIPAMVYSRYIPGILHTYVDSQLCSVVLLLSLIYNEPNQPTVKCEKPLKKVIYIIFYVTQFSSCRVAS